MCDNCRSMAADGGCLSNVLRNIDNIRRIAFDIGMLLMVVVLMVMRMTEYVRMARASRV